MDFEKWNNKAGEIKEYWIELERVLQDVTGNGALSI